MVYLEVWCWMTAVCLLIYFAANRGIQCSTQVRTRGSFMAPTALVVWCNDTIHREPLHTQWLPVSAKGQLIFEGRLSKYLCIYLWCVPRARQKLMLAIIWVSALDCFLHTEDHWGRLFMMSCLNHPFFPLSVHPQVIHYYIVTSTLPCLVFFLTSFLLALCKYTLQSWAI